MYADETLEETVRQLKEAGLQVVDAGSFSAVDVQDIAGIAIT